ncbi:MAG: winged helix-turn-helix domain-containing protein [Vicinamibacterales bacterium]
MSSGSVVRFGIFEADLASGELRRQGRLVKLQQQPFDLLAVLLEQPGQVVTREALHRRLWPDGVTVDFDQSLNKAVTKLRDALGDTAESPRFIETLPKRGYRFIAPVEVIGATPADGAAVPAIAASPAASAAPAPHAAPSAHAPHAPAPVLAPEPPAPSRAATLFSWVPIIGIGVVLAVLASYASVASRINADAPTTTRSLPSAAAPAMSTNAAAVDAFERGRIAASRRSAEGLRASLTHFEHALKEDARFGAAYVALADVQNLLAMDSLADPKHAMPAAREASNRALTLDSNNAAAHAALGRTTMLFDWDWKIAVWHFERARDLAPTNANVRQWFADCYAAMGMKGEAETEARAALALLPLDLGANTTLGRVFYLAKDYDKAEAQLRKTLEIDPGYLQARRLLGLTLTLAEKHAQALPEFERAAQLAGETPNALADLAMSRAFNGDEVGARRLLTRLSDPVKQSAWVGPDGIAQVYWALNDRDTAAQWLQKAYDARVPVVAYLMTDPLWDGVRDDPRVRDMIEGIKNGKAPAAPLP